MRRNPTEAERALWRVLRNKRLAGWKFKRQQPLGRYIVDFVCFEARLIVEADGSQHLDSVHDARRDAWLQAQGFRLLRFWNNDILARPDGVLTAVLAALDGHYADVALPPLPQPLPRQGGGESGACLVLADATQNASPLAGEERGRSPSGGRWAVMVDWRYSPSRACGEGIDDGASLG